MTARSGTGFTQRDSQLNATEECSRQLLRLSVLSMTPLSKIFSWTASSKFIAAGELDSSKPLQADDLIWVGEIFRSSRSQDRGGAPRHDREKAKNS
jgi:hypothetical protein